MFENYSSMTQSEKDCVKRTHKSIRSLSLGRVRNLAWAWIRDFPYSRVERKTKKPVDPVDLVDVVFPILLGEGFIQPGTENSLYNKFYSWLSESSEEETPAEELSNAAQ